MATRIALAVAGIVVMSWGMVVFRDYRSVTTRVMMFAKRRRLEAMPLTLGFYRFIGLVQFVFGLVFVLVAVLCHPNFGRHAS